MTGAAHAVVTADRFTAALVLDGGTFRVDPPAAAATSAISADLARCNLLAGYNNSNFDLFHQTEKLGQGYGGLTFGLGVVTVASSLLGEHSSNPGESGPNQPQLRPLEPYQHRLAWVAVTRPEVVTSCPASGPAVPDATTPADAYQVVAIDAQTGGGGIIYTARAPQFCGHAGLRPASLDTAMQRLSVPWTPVGRDTQGRVTSISIPMTDCDGFNGASADPDTAVLTVSISHPLSDCGTPRPRTEPVSIGTAGQPSVLRHGPIGAQDIPVSEYGS